jgi:hypothetical protein
MRNPPNLLFVAGIPASGKSHFGEWLQATQGYLHIDAEVAGGQLDALALHKIWDAALHSTNARPFVDAVRTLDRAIILNWGFPPSYLPFIASLRSAGFSPWWFDADVSAARTGYCQAGRSPVAFDGQLAEIRAAWPAIQQAFAPNIVRVLESDGARMPPVEIFRIVCGSDS